MAEAKEKKAKATKAKEAKATKAKETKAKATKAKEVKAKVTKAKEAKATKAKEMGKKELIAAIEKLPDEGKSAVMLELVKGMTVLGLSDFVKACEDAFGVSAAPAPVVAAPGAPAPAAAEEEKTEFDVILKEIGPKKIPVIKAVREITHLGLKESKELVDSAPSPVVKGVPKKEAEEVKAKLEEQGAVAEIK